MQTRESLAAALSRDDLRFLLAKATQRWNELLAARFAAAGHPDVRPSSGSVLLPLYEQDGLRMGELARRARLSKQTMTPCANSWSSSRARARLQETARKRKPAPRRGGRAVESSGGACA